MSDFGWHGFKNEVVFLFKWELSYDDLLAKRLFSVFYLQKIIAGGDGTSVYDISVAALLCHLCSE